MNLPDVQNEKSHIPIAIKKVGVIGVKAPVSQVYFAGGYAMMLPVFDVYIDLPADQKGIHASRNYEIIPEVLNRYAARTCRLEELCVAIATELLESHAYATRSEVKARGEVILEKAAPKSGKSTYEACRLMASAVAVRGAKGAIGVAKTLGVDVVGITACPCAYEMLREYSEERLIRDEKLPRRLAGKIISMLPTATHMQRSHGQVFTEVPDGVEVDAAALAQVVERSLSASTYGLLKRADEAELIKQAVTHTRFAEDCIRHMMRNFARAFPKMPDSTTVTFRIRSEESIHKHDLMAERTIRLGEIRRELKGRV